MAKKIVILDDEEDMAQLLKIELETEGYEVSFTHDGKSGLDLIKKSKPDLVILDVMMPVMDGYEVLMALKNDAQTKEIPVIMLTARGLKADIDRGLALDADDYIAKPFHSEALVRRIHAILGNN